MTEGILVLNAGSSSIKFALFAIEEAGQLLPLRYRGEIEGLGSRPHFLVVDAAGKRVVDDSLTGGEGADGDYEAVLPVLVEWIEGHSDGLTVVAMGHRVVHGGARLTAPVVPPATTRSRSRSRPGCSILLASCSRRRPGPCSCRCRR